MWDELENALAWFAAAPGRWVSSAKQDMAAAAEWIWEVLQGDFADEQTTGQVVTGTVISMIPIVDQICDVRDLVANCKKINQDSDDKWAWVALILTSIGLFPTLGSLVKGCLKILFAYGRKAMFNAGKAALDSGMWQASKPFIEAGILKLNDFLAGSKVRGTLAFLGWDNPYKYLADEVRKVSSGLTVGKLLSAFDTGIDALRDLLKLVDKWGTAAMQTQTGQLLEAILRVRRKADRALADALAPAQNFLNRLAQRLDVEWRTSFPAHTNNVNPHGSVRLSLDAEVEHLRKAKPKWVRVAKEAPRAPLEESPPVPAGHFDIGLKGDGHLRSVFKTFAEAHPDTLAPGTTLVRVVAPKSADNGVYWMTKGEFEKLHSKPEWRERFAVWQHWNSNGEFVTYTVPPGKTLPVWRGPTASQQLEDRAGNPVRADDNGSTFWLEGGHEQIVVNPSDLDKASVSERQFTGWGYDDAGIQANLVGVPILKNHWNERGN